MHIQYRCLNNSHIDRDINEISLCHMNKTHISFEREQH